MPKTGFAIVFSRGFRGTRKNDSKENLLEGVNFGGLRGVLRVFDGFEGLLRGFLRGLRVLKEMSRKFGTSAENSADVLGHPESQARPLQLPKKTCSSPNPAVQFAQA